MLLNLKFWFLETNFTSTNFQNQKVLSVNWPECLSLAWRDRRAESWSGRRTSTDSTLPVLEDCSPVSTSDPAEFLRSGMPLFNQSDTTKKSKNKKLNIFCFTVYREASFVTLDWRLPTTTVLIEAFYFLITNLNFGNYFTKKVGFSSSM